MVRYAVGYTSRAFVTFGTPIPVTGIDPGSRRAVLDLSHAVMRAIGSVYKVLPTAVVASAMRPSIDAARAGAARRRAARHAARSRRQPRCHQRCTRSGRRARPLESRGILVVNRGRFACGMRNVLRYYARDRHLSTTCSTRAAPVNVLLARTEPHAETFRVACGMTPNGFARRFIAGETMTRRTPPARCRARGMLLTLDYLGESVNTTKAARGRARVRPDHRRPSSRPASSATSR